jgi:hypothetical protein
MLKMIILPRQARDKHREISKQRPFSQVEESWHNVRGADVLHVWQRGVQDGN